MFRKLVSLDEARRTIEKSVRVKPVGMGQASLFEAFNRTLAEDIVASSDVPPFSRSTVDGYAVHAEDTFGAEETSPVNLKLGRRVNVGEMPVFRLNGGEAAEIVTGAPLPEGADAVVMVEHTARKNGSVAVYRAVSKEENVMKAGSDIRKGETVLRSGHVLGARQIGVAAALGITTLRVYKKPLVAVLSTGPEITMLGQPLAPGKIYDINGYTLSAAVLECGGSLAHLETVPDEEKLVKAKLAEALAKADLVVTSGGVSVGSRDIIPKVLNEFGKPGVIVCGVAVKPGKPTTVAVVNGKLVFSLPGHPTSALLMFYLLVRPVVYRLGGLEAPALQTVRAKAEVRLFSARGRRTFTMVNICRDEDGMFSAVPVDAGQSGAITTLGKADGFVEIPETTQFIDAGEEVVVHLLKV